MNKWQDTLYPKARDGNGFRLLSMLLIFGLFLSCPKISRAENESFPDTSNPSLANNTVIQYLRDGRYNEVVAQYDADSPTILITFDTVLVGAYAFALNRVQRETEAVELLVNVTAWDNQFSFDYLGIAQAHKFLGLFYLGHEVYSSGKTVSYSNAIHSFSRTVEADGSAENCNLLALAYSSEARIKNSTELMNRAVNYGARALSQDTANWVLYYNQGGYYEYLKDTEMAMQNYSMAQAMGEAAYPVYYQIGILQMKQGEYDNARVTFRTFIGLDINANITGTQMYGYLISKSYFKLAACYAIQCNTENTIAILREAQTEGIIFPEPQLLNDREFLPIATDQTYLEFINNEY